MSWMKRMYETYNRCEDYVGKDGETGERPLVPICHHSEIAHVEITIDQDGNLLEANSVRGKSPITIVPCTEDSASKSNNPQPHPLSEKLQYVAGDFLQYSGKAKKEPFSIYERQLTEWCGSEFAHPKAQAVLNYVKKKTVVKDLVERKLLLIGSDGKLTKKYENGKTFIRWIIRSENVEEIEETWKDQSLRKSWESYYLTLGAKGEKVLCMITGRIAISSNKHPKFIRTSSDGAKLISSNDTEWFTYRGRFENAQQAFTVSLEVSQKAHSTLKWLIDRQGHVFTEPDPRSKKKRNPRLTVLAWAITDEKMPQPTSGSIEIMKEPEPPTTKQDFALKLRNKMLGYSSKLEKDQAKSLQVMAMDSAVKGRMAITYYRELESLDYFEQLEKWHNGCGWLQNGFDEKTKKYFRFFGVPSPLSIADAAYGKKADDKIKNATIARLLPCIIDGQKVPADIVNSVVRRASNRIGFQESRKKGEKKDKYENEWNQTLSIACSLFKKTNEEKEYDMSLDETKTTRDYLYGRLLAVADYIEEKALFKAEKTRVTNAARYMQQFSQRPYRTWSLLHNELLRPYVLRLGRSAFHYIKIIEEITCNFEEGDFKNDNPLSGEYLLGFYCQKQKLRDWKSTSTNSDMKNDNAQDSDQ